MKKVIFEEVKIEEKVDVEKVIGDLGKTDFSGSNEEQGAAVQLLRGIAFSDDPKANEFMKELDKATAAIAKKMGIN